MLVQTSLISRILEAQREAIKEENLKEEALSGANKKLETGAYGIKSPLCWLETRDRQLTRLDIIQETVDKITTLKERLKTARSRQKDRAISPPDERDMVDLQKLAKSRPLFGKRSLTLDAPQVQPTRNPNLQWNGCSDIEKQGYNVKLAELQIRNIATTKLIDWGLLDDIGFHWWLDKKAFAGFIDKDTNKLLPPDEDDEEDKDEQEIEHEENVKQEGHVEREAPIQQMEGFEELSRRMSEVYEIVLRLIYQMDYFEPILTHYAKAHNLTMTHPYNSPGVPACSSQNVGFNSSIVGSMGHEKDDKGAAPSHGAKLVV
nr:hypothetical protein [Tanacetum cinerariifolium]